MNLFRCGHLQQVEALNTNDTMWLQAYCLPGMKKDKTYKVELFIPHSKWLVSAGVQLGKDLQLHVNTSVLFAICLWVSVKAA